MDKRYLFGVLLLCILCSFIGNRFFVYNSHRSINNEIKIFGTTVLSSDTAKAFVSTSANTPLMVEERTEVSIDSEDARSQEKSMLIEREEDENPILVASPSIVAREEFQEEDSPIVYGLATKEMKVMEAPTIRLSNNGPSESEMARTLPTQIMKSEEVQIAPQSSEQPSTDAVSFREETAHLATTSLPKLVREIIAERVISSKRADFDSQGKREDSFDEEEGLLDEESGKTLRKAKRDALKKANDAIKKKQLGEGNESSVEEAKEQKLGDNLFPTIMENGKSVIIGQEIQDDDKQVDVESLMEMMKNSHGDAYDDSPVNEDELISEEEERTNEEEEAKVMKKGMKKLFRGYGNHPSFTFTGSADSNVDDKDEEDNTILREIMLLQKESRHERQESEKTVDKALKRKKKAGYNEKMIEGLHLPLSWKVGKTDLSLYAKSQIKLPSSKTVLQQDSHKLVVQRSVYSTSLEKNIHFLKGKGVTFSSVHSNKKDQAKCLKCVLIIGNAAFKYETKYPFEYNMSENPSYTIIMTTTPNRLPFIPYFLDRWPSEICIAVHVRKEAYISLKKSLLSMNLPKRIRIILHIVSSMSSEYDNFPVNKLRNIAIVNIVTTHFIVLDMDMWPSYNLYDELKHIPESISSSSTSVVIVPAFFLKKEPILEKCSSLLSCAQLSSSLFPHNKTSLLNCLYEKRCLLYKTNTITHRYINYKWFLVNHAIHLLKVSCFFNRYQEPYLVIKNDPNTVLFDERFINYGCNKVQYVDHIRHMGYQFFLLTNAFSMDIVHHDSGYRKKYLANPSNRLAPTMKVFCYDFQKQLRAEYPSALNQTKICSSLRSSIYKSI